jgi:hypothetical protein
MNMMNLKEVNETLDHKITMGSEYQWHCYGPDARFLDYESDYAHASVIYSTKTQEIFQAEISTKTEVWDDKKPYRWLNPAHKDTYLAEAKERGIDPNNAWDTTEWIDLELPEDFLEKAKAIFNGDEYDTRIQVPIDLEDDLLLQLAMEAHKRDITLNNMIEIILQGVIDNHSLKE